MHSQRALLPRSTRRALHIACTSRRPLAGPVVIKLTTKHKTSVQVQPNGNPSKQVQHYMAQLSSRFADLDLPLGGKIEVVNRQRIKVLVPRVQLMDVWVQPKAFASVMSLPDRVEVTSGTDDCEITGSHHVLDMGLNDRYNLDVCLLFTWGAQPGHSSQIHTDLNFMVEIDIPAPFSFIPRPLLEATGNAAFGALLPVLINAFSTKMAADYKDWAQT